MSRRGQSSDANDGSPPPSDVLLTVCQVAENWQVSQRTTRRMIADGRLPIKRLGRAVRIPAKAAKC